MRQGYSYHTQIYNQTMWDYTSLIIQVRYHYPRMKESTDSSYGGSCRKWCKTPEAYTSREYHARRSCRRAVETIYSEWKEGSTREDYWRVALTCSLAACSTDLVWARASSMVRFALLIVFIHESHTSSAVPCTSSKLGSQWVFRIHSSLSFVSL